MGATHIAIDKNGVERMIRTKTKNTVKYWVCPDCGKKRDKVNPLVKKALSYWCPDCDMTLEHIEQEINEDSTN